MQALRGVSVFLFGANRVEILISDAAADIIGCIGDQYPAYSVIPV